MTLFSKDQITRASEKVWQQVNPTPQHFWPQITELLGTEAWVKHENHTATGAFKIRGGITFLDWLRAKHPNTKGIITATRGNHGQSQARAAKMAGLTAKIIVPYGNSAEKNTAMRTFGAELVEFGTDFDQAKAEAARLADAESLFMVPPFHEQIVLGVASYALELFSAVPDLDIVYVPVGCGSGICGLINVRDVLGLKTDIVGVVSAEAAAAKLSFEAGRITETSSADTFADGMAVRIPVPAAFDIYRNGASRIVAVSDDEIAEAMRIYYSATHNIAEGAGAASLAAAIQEKSLLRGKKAGLILSGANIDKEVFVQVMSGITPTVARTEYLPGADLR